MVTATMRGRAGTGVPRRLTNRHAGFDSRQPTRSADTKTAPRLTTGQRTKKEKGDTMTHTPHIYYWTQPTTRGTHNVATHLHAATTPIRRDTPPPAAPYVIMTPTYAGHPQRGGYLPSAVKHWLKNHQAQRYLVGVIGTGDINWGNEFCAAADEISRTHDVPVLHRIDRWGSEDDHRTINQGLDNHWAELCRQRIATLKARKTKQQEESW